MCVVLLLLFILISTVIVVVTVNKICFTEETNALKSSLQILTRSQKQQRCFFIYVNIITTARSYK